MAQRLGSQKRPFAIYFLVSSVPRGRLVMAILDLDTPGSVGRSSVVGRSSAPVRLCLLGILIFSCVMVGVAPCSAQDVAAAAREQRAQVQQWVRNYQRLKEGLEAISELNHELLRP